MTTPAQAIAQTAARLGVDAICIASHGRSGISRALVGSVADKLIRATRKPVVRRSAPAVPRPTRTLRASDAACSCNRPRTSTWRTRSRVRFVIDADLLERERAPVRDVERARVLRAPTARGRGS